MILRLPADMVELNELAESKDARKLFLPSNCLTVFSASFHSASKPRFCFLSTVLGISVIKLADLGKDGYGLLN